MDNTAPNDTPTRRFASRKARIGIAAAVGVPLAIGAVLALTIPAAAAPQPGSPAGNPAGSPAVVLDSHSGNVGSVIQGQTKVDPKLNLKDGSGSVSAGPDGQVHKSTN
ncbi:MAG: hypothetical protein BGO26_14115 [Actinobacteria bacterium 69-20]|jgi:hypothetical protein|nr:hypothetical protein [Actinomycetota bacterium]OJV29468.1 MAG: hypothetical protein BGO26_14115 [Actinobacteria bacterium 69-20]